LQREIVQGIRAMQTQPDAAAAATGAGGGGPRGRGRKRGGGEKPEVVQLTSQLGGVSIEAEGADGDGQAAAGRSQTSRRGRGRGRARAEETGEDVIPALPALTADAAVAEAGAARRGGKKSARGARGSASAATAGNSEGAHPAPGQAAFGTGTNQAELTANAGAGGGQKKPGKRRGGGAGGGTAADSAVRQELPQTPVAGNAAKGKKNKAKGNGNPASFTQDASKLLGPDGERIGAGMSKGATVGVTSRWLPHVYGIVSVIVCVGSM